MSNMENDTLNVLKLDHLDVIPNLNFHYEDICPVWSVSNSKSLRHGDEYVEFCVMAGKRNYSNCESVIEDGDSIGYPTYKCAICDTDIPILYKKEHNNSNKHKTSLKIVEAVLARIQSLLQFDNEDFPVKKSQNTYFCDHCAVIVKNTDKIVHEASNFHQKSVLRDRLFNDFLNVYLDTQYLDRLDMPYLKLEENIKKINDKLNETKVHDVSEAEETIACKNYKTTFGDVNYSSNDENINTLQLPVREKKKRKTTTKNKDSQNNIQSGQLPPNSIKQNKSGDENNENKKPSSSTVDYMKLVNPKEYDVDMKTETVKNNVLSKTDLEKYLKLVDNQRLSCLSEDYIKINTLDECIVIVKANNFNGFYLKDGRLQCRLCMEIVDEIPEEHIYTADHVKHVKAPLENIHCYRKINYPFNHCIHCNDTFCDVNIHKCIESHLEALKESMYRSIPAQPEPKKNGKTFCQPCKEIDSHNFNAHTKGKPHKNNPSLFFTKNTKTENLPGNSSNKTYCNKCNSYVLIANFAVHLNQHANTDKFGNSSKKTSIDIFFCEPCNKHLTKHAFRSHVYSKYHQACLVLANSRMQTDNYCATCNICVETMSSHMTGAYHKFYLNKNSVSSTPASSSTSEITSNQYQMNISENGASCRICLVKVTNKSKNIKDHTNGRAHKANYMTLLSNNKIKLANKKCFCEACNATMDLTQELDHIKSKPHRTALTQFDKIYCSICKFFVLTSNWSNHLSSEHHEIRKLMQ